MTERIYSDEDLSAIRLQCYEAGRLGKEAYTVRGGGEVVVRCRDCAHAIRLEGEPAEARPGMLNCAYFAQWDYYDDEPGVWLVEPDGFCAWASRREDGQCRTLR